MTHAHPHGDGQDTLGLKAQIEATIYGAPFAKVLRCARLAKARDPLHCVFLLFLIGLAFSSAMGSPGKYVRDPVILFSCAAILAGLLSFVWYLRALPSCLLALQRIFSWNSATFISKVRKTHLYKASYGAIFAALLLIFAAGVAVTLWLWQLPSPPGWFSDWRLLTHSYLLQGFTVLLILIEAFILGVGAIGYATTMGLIWQLRTEKLNPLERISHIVISAFYARLTSLGLFALAFASFLDVTLGGPIRGFSIFFIVSWLFCYVLVQLGFHYAIRHAKKQMLEALRPFAREAFEVSPGRAQTRESIEILISKQNAWATYALHISEFPDWLMNSSTGMQIIVALVASVLPLLLKGLFV